MDHPIILNDMDWNEFYNPSPTDEELEAIEEESLSDLDWADYMESLA